MASVVVLVTSAAEAVAAMEAKRPTATVKLANFFICDPPSVFLGLAVFSMFVLC
ncbi:hypothetical protein D3C81_1790510 [compost metagenome]